MVRSSIRLCLGCPDVFVGDCRGKWNRRNIRYERRHLKIIGKLLPINFANPKNHATFAVVILYNLFYLICGLVPAKNGIAEHLGVSLFSSLYLRGLLAGKYHEWLLLCHDG